MDPGLYPMAAMVDPYKVLGVPPTASDAELRTAYRKLVQLHHPDHNNGSAESARRFEEVQEAYAEARRRRTVSGRSAPPPPPPPPTDPHLDARLAAMERELREARNRRADAERAREQALRDARAAAAEAGTRPTDEELGYVSTDDSFSKIFDDAAAAFGRHLDDARHAPEAKRAARRVADVLDDIADRLTGERRPRR